MKVGEHSPIPLPEKLPVAQSQMRDGEVESEEEKKGHVTHPLVLDFLQLAVAHGADEGIIERNKWATIRYLTTEVTLDETAPFLGVTTKGRSRQVVMETLEKLWEASPSELQSKYSLEEVLLKDTKERLKSNCLPTYEVIAKIKAGNIGKTQSDKARELVRQYRLGTHHTEETIAKIRAKNLGKRHTAETIEKMRQSHRDRINKAKNNVTATQ